MEKEYSHLITSHPETISMEQLYQVCHNSKRKARWLLENGMIPCVDFFVPMKAIVLRMVELGNIDHESAAILLGCGNVPEKDILDLFQHLISEYGFIKFQNLLKRNGLKGFQIYWKRPK